MVDMTAFMMATVLVGAIIGCKILVARKESGRVIEPEIPYDKYHLVTK